jgi:hypothetical protein
MPPDWGRLASFPHLFPIVSHVNWNQCSDFGVWMIGVAIAMPSETEELTPVSLHGGVVSSPFCQRRMQRRPFCFMGGAEFQRGAAFVFLDIRESVQQYCGMLS